MSENTYTLIINRRAQEERERKEQERIARANLLKLQASTGQATRTRKRKGLNFHEPGTFVAKAEKLRKEAKIEALRRKIAAATSKTGIADDVKLASLTTNIARKEPAATASKDSSLVLQDVPEIEWWDKPLLKGKSLDQIVFRLNQNCVRPEEIFEGISNLVEHPLIKEPPGPDQSAIPVRVFLTPKETKKLRRQTRKRAELEKQQNIKLGLLPKPEPKLKRSNIKFALGEEAIINPSMAEQLVKDQEEKRLQAHIEHNESKKLTAEQKRAKNLRKIKEDLTITGTWVSVYRVTNLSSEAHKFKVTKNARQLTMTGVLVLYNDLNIVVVEGGPRQQRKFKHLMMDRIQWNNSPKSPDDTTQPVNRCLLVWEGQVGDRSFKKFNVRQMKSESEVKDFFKQSKVEHYWDLAYKMSILESIEEP